MQPCPTSAHHVQAQRRARSGRPHLLAHAYEPCPSLSSAAHGPEATRAKGPGEGPADRATTCRLAGGGGFGSDPGIRAGPGPCLTHGLRTPRPNTTRRPAAGCVAGEEIGCSRGHPPGSGPRWSDLESEPARAGRSESLVWPSEEGTRHRRRAPGSPRRPGPTPGTAARPRSSNGAGPRQCRPGPVVLTSRPRRWHAFPWPSCPSQAAPASAMPGQASESLASWPGAAR